MKAVILVLCLMTIAPATAASHYFNIPAGSLAPAATLWSAQAKLQVLYDPTVLEPLTTVGVSGWYEDIQALQILLQGTLLTPQPVNPRTWTVVPIDVCRPELADDAPVPPCWGLAMQVRL